MRRGARRRRAAGGQPRRDFRTAVLLAAVATLLFYACSSSSSGGGDTAASVSTPLLPATPPPDLTVQRGGQSCYISRQPAADIPPVRGYRLVAVNPLPDGVSAVVKSTPRFAGTGAARTLEAEICVSAEAAAAPGSYDATLELRLYNADSERLSSNDRLQPIRTLPIHHTLHIV